ncbi:hypothetical protein K402DRAFT_152054 [Aulographum hederae CBS 113979]|uniref:Jacalin-type lectin domain-containing protein n=1 Tax=Aulographum hederae CBS 113979 TaxID=1176131 RepID=A0A6G1GSF9_9PEZI|nr:hypothetical protein K402DRAFT_152054 [Aulographum hederae CBS 113979]
MSDAYWEVETIDIGTDLSSIGLEITSARHGGKDEVRPGRPSNHQMKWDVGGLEVFKSCSNSRWRWGDQEGNKRLFVAQPYNKVVGFKGEISGGILTRFGLLKYPTDSGRNTPVPDPVVMQNAWKDTLPPPTLRFHPPGSRSGYAAGANLELALSNFCYSQGHWHSTTSSALKDTLLARSLGFITIMKEHSTTMGASFHTQTRSGYQAITVE